MVHEHTDIRQRATIILFPETVTDKLNESSRSFPT